MLRRFFADLYLTRRFFMAWGLVILGCLCAYFIPSCVPITLALALGILLLCGVDLYLLFRFRQPITGQREVAERFSLAEVNEVKLHIQSKYPFTVQLTILDELPEVLQIRDLSFSQTIEASGKCEIQYPLIPRERGEYRFGVVWVYVSTRLSLIERRCQTCKEQMVKVYPAFQQLRKYQLQAIGGVAGSGQTMQTYRQGFSHEFEQIREYVRGDDSRLMNWKASARRGNLMINTYREEMSQSVFCIIDKGRLMRMPFEGITLLDYSINAALMFSYVALQKDDKAGLITFAEKVYDVVLPTRNRRHFHQIIETLYNQQTQFLESNFAALYQRINQQSSQRSLLMLFTHFETFTSFERQLPYLKAMNRKHILCVVLFENTELEKIHTERGDNLEDIYIKTIADRFANEKKRIVLALKQQGILAICTPPAGLTVAVVNQYLSLKKRHIV